jgi:hypothetical protein
MTTATANYPTTLRNGRTEYRVEFAETAAFERGPAFYLHGARGAHYLLAPAIDYTEANPVWILLTMKSSNPFDFVTITNGEWDVIR